MICRKGEEMATPGTKKQIDPKLAPDQKNVHGHNPQNSPVDLTQPTEQSNPVDQGQQIPHDGSEENAGDKGNPPDLHKGQNQPHNSKFDQDKKEKLGEENRQRNAKQ
jgi:hypothetical protein